MASAKASATSDFFEDDFDVLLFFFSLDLIVELVFFASSATASMTSFFELDLLVDVFDFSFGVSSFFSELLYDFLVELFDLTVLTIISVASSRTSFSSLQLFDVVVFFFSDVFDDEEDFLASSIASAMASATSDFLPEDDFDVLAFFSLLSNNFSDGFCNFRYLL